MEKNRDGFEIDKIDLVNLDNIYKTGELLSMLGFTRDTLRHYESLGIIKPQKNEVNNYRQYDTYDIYKLLGIEYYKKRGISLTDIQKIISGSDFTSLTNIFMDKEIEIKEQIKREEQKLYKLQESLQFLSQLQNSLNQFCLKKFPLYEIINEFSAISSFDEYPKNVISHIDLQQDDIFSCTVRKVTFDSNQYLDTRMYLVRRVESDHIALDKQYLKQQNCIYTVVESGRFSDENHQVIEDTRKAGLEWAKQNGFKPIGVVYLFMRLMLFQDKKERNFVEAWIPIE